MTTSVFTGADGFAPANDSSLRDRFTAWLHQGFARSMVPVAASVITTDTNGLTAGEIKLDTRDGPIPAYRAVPEKNGKYPVVLVVQEIFGVYSHIKSVADGFAAEGYLAIAPAYFDRAQRGPVGRTRARRGHREKFCPPAGPSRGHSRVSARPNHRCPRAFWMWQERHA